MSKSNATRLWFGESFDQLHPLLQKLHTDGGSLSGSVDIQFGQGIAGMLGRRIAKKLGVPTSGPDNTLRVDINHSDSQMFWNRTFNVDDTMKSVFEPVGTFPDGVWREDTGALSLQLRVDIINGGWHWILKEISLKGIQLPLWFAPRTDAYKTIIDNRYVFSVTVSVPLLGTIMSYGGRLTADE